MTKLLRPSLAAAVYMAAGMMFSSTSSATVFHFDDDPFAGSTALTTAGRQVVGGEPSITFDPATDSFAFSEDAFGVSALSFFNGPASSVPATGTNVIVLQTFDVPFAAGTAANLIAAQITSSAPGFFIYFNSGLDLARLVFSTDLNDNTADLKILARMTNLAGAEGRESFADFTAENFSVKPSTVPEGDSVLSLAIAAFVLAGARIMTRRTSQR